MQIKRRDLAAPHLDLTPLIDVLFQVMVFLLMTSNFTDLGTISVSLPNASHSDPAREAPSVTLKKDGSLQLGEKPVTPGSFSGELKQLLDQRPDKNVSVIADKDIPLRQLVFAMDGIRAAGGEGVLVLTSVAN